MTGNHHDVLTRLEDSAHFWIVGRDQLVTNLLDRYEVDGAILDAGSGTGSFAQRLDTSVGGETKHVIALDADPLTGRERRPARVVRGDIEALPFADGSLDAVLARDVLEHVDDGLALAECHRVLRPGGLLVSVVPAWPRLWSARDVRAGHRRRYTRSTLRAALAAASFHLEELRGYQFALLPITAASRVAAGVGRRTRSGAVLTAEEQPPRAINAVLRTINRGEASLAKHAWARPPVGTSLVAVARAK